VTVIQGSGGKMIGITNPYDLLVVLKRKVFRTVSDFLYSKNFLIVFATLTVILGILAVKYLEQFK